MSVLLLPRLSKPSVEEILSEGMLYAEAITEADLFETSKPFVTYAATGGSKVSDDDLFEFRHLMVNLAEKFGFPGRAKATRQKADFDSKAAAIIYTHPLLQTPEVLRDDVWAYMATVLLQDVALWRFQSFSINRFQGGIRNAFQRLWMRANCLDRGSESASRWELINQLSEDAFVAITERSSIASNKKLSLAIGEAWLRFYNGKQGLVNMEPIMRKAIILIRMKNLIQNIAQLNKQECEIFMDRIFAYAADKHLD